MSYTFMPSLQQRALVKITAALWNRSDIRDLVARCSTLCNPFTINAREWQVIEDKVIERVPKLPLPESLKKEVLDLAQRIGLEVKKWKEYHGYHSGCYLGTDVSAELFWTPQGTVDQKKTAEVLIKDGSIDITTRYKLACIYCLEGDVKELWNSVPQREKEDIYNDVKYDGEKKLILLWTYYITDITKFSDLIKEMDEREISPNQFQFEYSAEYGIKVATEYFLQKLTPKERDESLVKCAMDLANKHLFFSITSDYKYDDLEVNDAEILCFLLSQMNEEQQVKVFEKYPAGVLSCLMDWPCESFFMETANRVWSFLSEDHYKLLLRDMVFRIMDSFKNCNFHKLFGEFWQRSPNTYKKNVFGILTSEFLLSYLFRIEDKENIRLVLKDVTMEEREEILFTYPGMSICEDLIYSNKWDLIKFFVEECMSSEDMMIELIELFKDLIINHISEESSESKIDLWKKFCQLVGDLCEDNKKRRMEEKNISSAKRRKFSLANS